MKIEIKHRYTDEIIFSHECENNSIKITLELAVKNKANLDGAYLEGASLYRAYLEGASLYRANLRGANLYKASLYGANLEKANMYRANMYGANLDGANLDGANIDGAYLERANLKGATYGAATLKNGLFQMLGKYWPVFIFDAHIKIGCKLYSTNEWEAFSDDEISLMDKKALKFWKENKSMIIGLARQLQK